MAGGSGWHDLPVSKISAAHFDEWYAAMPASRQQQQIQADALGLPAHLLATSLLPFDGIDDVAAALRLAPGDTLVDLACGRGGYGLEIAERCGARLLGVDFSAVALDAARESAGAGWPAVDAEFRLGDLVDTGLPAGCAAAVLCVDAAQFAEPLQGLFTEARRILAPGGRLVVTGWQAHDVDDDAIPVRMRHDLAAAATAAGFRDATVTDQPGWAAAERRMWELALAADPDGDDAVASMQQEAHRVLAVADALRRVSLTATAPGANHTP